MESLIIIIVLILVLLYISGLLSIYLISTNNIMLWNRKRSILPFEGIDEKSTVNPHIVYWTVANPIKNDKWVILLHQYGGRSDFMVKQGKIYYELGFNLLFIDARSHGLSQFTRESNGVVYARDMIDIIQKEHIKDIFLHGVSFGGIAVLIAIKLIPKDIYIRGIIVEAIPKDIKNIYKNNIKYSPLPYFLYFWFPNFMRFRRKQFDWEGNSLDSILSQLTCPVMIIHSGSDKLYDPEIHFKTNKKAIANNKNGEAWLAPGMQHSHMNEHPEWESKVKSFVLRFI